MTRERSQEPPSQGKITRYVHGHNSALDQEIHQIVTPYAAAVMLTNVMLIDVILTELKAAKKHLA